MQWNQIAFDFLHGFFGRNGPLNGVVFFFADQLTYILVAGIFLFLFRIKGNRSRIFWAGKLAIAYLFSRWFLTAWIQFFFPMSRPFKVLEFDPVFIPWTSASFPSAHTSSLFAVAVILFFANKKWGIAYIVLATLVGVGRISLGLHWPVDIVGGVVIGSLSAILVHYLLPKPKDSLDIKDAKL